jgi:hypothetical protein
VRETTADSRLPAGAEFRFLPGTFRSTRLLFQTFSFEKASFKTKKAGI